jgi:hypothetical protein
MPKVKLSWQEKLIKQEKKAREQGYPKVIEITGKMTTRWGTGTCVIPAPLEVNDIMKTVPEGRLITINQIRQILAVRHGANIG